MGRHARGAVRPRVTARIVVVAAAAVLAVVAGSWWAMGSAPSADATVSAPAVVVSSLACRNGDEGTVVDLLDPAGGPPGSTRRATIDSCGHQPGEMLTVEYPVTDPDRVVPSGMADGADDATGRLLPLGLVVVALLGLAAVAVVVRDSRRGHRSGGIADPGPGGSAASGYGRHARRDEEDVPTPLPEPPSDGPGRPSEPDLLMADQEQLRDNLHHELFTHRSTAGV